MDYFSTYQITRACIRRADGTEIELPGVPKIEAEGAHPGVQVVNLTFPTIIMVVGVVIVPAWRMLRVSLPSGGQLN